MREQLRHGELPPRRRRRLAMKNMQIKPREVGFGPVPALEQIRDAMDRVFDRFTAEPFEWGWGGNGKWIPALDVIDAESEFLIKAEIPGMDPKDVNISISGDRLTLSGEKEESTEDKRDNYFVSERRFGSFQRTVQLPEGADTEKVIAEQANGVLTVRIPKLKAVKPRQVPIKAAS
jgi:HSP20 family protein